MRDRYGLRATGVTLVLGICFAWTMAHMPGSPSLNAKFVFSGKVTDQQGRPLAAVQVGYRYSIQPGNARGRGLSPEESRHGETLTDPAGRFAIVAPAGRVLTLESFTKAGYAPSPDGQRVFDFYGSSRETKFVADSAKPVSITMIELKGSTP